MEIKAKFSLQNRKNACLNLNRELLIICFPDSGMCFDQIVPVDDVIILYFRNRIDGMKQLFDFSFQLQWIHAQQIELFDFIRAKHLLQAHIDDHDIMMWRIKRSNWPIPLHQTIDCHHIGPDIYLDFEYDISGQFDISSDQSEVDATFQLNQEPVLDVSWHELRSDVQHHACRLQDIVFDVKHAQMIEEFRHDFISRLSMFFSCFVAEKSNRVIYYHSCHKSCKHLF